MFVYLDQLQVNGRRNALARLNGDQHEIVMLDVAPTRHGGDGEGSCPHCLVHDGPDAYFPAHEGVYMITPEASEPRSDYPPRYAGGAQDFQIVNELFFHDVQTDAGPWQLVQGTLADPAGARVVVELNGPDPNRVWVGTAAGVFWTDGREIRSAPLPVE